jgi:hypothetical protein
MKYNPNPILKDLVILVGEWKMELSFPVDPEVNFAGNATFEWMEDGAFLKMRQGNKEEGPPYSISIISRDNSEKPYTMLYFDDRGVSRIYQMSLEGRELKQWRDSPGFSQRFIGVISGDGNTITARWEKSSDGSHWEHDFNIIFKRKIEFHNI